MKTKPLAAWSRNWFEALIKKHCYPFLYQTVRHEVVPSWRCMHIRIHCHEKSFSKSAVWESFDKIKKFQKKFVGLNSKIFIFTWMIWWDLFSYSYCLKSIQVVAKYVSFSNVLFIKINRSFCSACLEKMILEFVNCN